MPPLVPEGKEAGDRDPYRQRGVFVPEDVEDLGDHGERCRLAGDHQPQPPAVLSPGAGQRLVVTGRGEGAGRERHHHGGDGASARGRPQARALPVPAPQGRLSPGMRPLARTG